MKSARDVAIDVVHEVIGTGFSRPMFVQILQDTGDIGKGAKDWVNAIEKAVERDRASLQKALGPS